VELLLEVQEQGDNSDKVVIAC